MFNLASHARGESVPTAPVRESSDRTRPLPDPALALARLRHRPWLAALGGALGLAAALAGLPQLTPAYTAAVEILIDPADLRIVENGIQPSAAPADSGISIAESQVRVIGSDSVLGRVVRGLDLQHDPEFAKPPSDPGSLGEAVKRRLGLGVEDGSTDPALRAVEELRRRTTVRRPERTFVIEVLVRSAGREKSATIANAIAATYFAQETAARAGAAGRASDALTARLGELKGALQGAENRLAGFREERHLVAANGRLLVDQRLGELDQQLTAASVRAADERTRAEQARRLRAVGGTALPEMLQSPEMRALRQQLADLARTNAETATRLGPRHPVVSEQAAQLREIEAAIAREKIRVIDSTLKEADRAAATEDALRRQVERLKGETTASDRALITLRELERDVEAQRTLYESFLRRARETGQQERLDSINMRVISPATPPLGRSWPPSPRVVLPLALVLGLLLGAGSAVLWPVRPDERGWTPVPVRRAREGAAG